MPDHKTADEERSDRKTCGGAMFFVAAAPCRVNPLMEKRTYFCFACSRLKTFALHAGATHRS